ncbi:MAG TPA: hypothetical protein VGM82_21920 [Gemmatimonadaceae bacterium]
MLVAALVVSAAKRTVIVAVPTDRPVTNPVLETVATLLLEEFHCSELEVPALVESCVVEPMVI